MNIDVTQDDIDRGIPGYCDRCPVALAIRRQFPGPVVVSVRMRMIRIDDRFAPSPNSVRNFIKNFDLHADDAAPFSFDLDLEEPQ